MDNSYELRGRPGRGRRKPPQRRTLNCLPCRSLKLKCNRRAPCESCIRHGREEACLRNPPPEAQLSQNISSQKGSTLDTILPAPSLIQIQSPQGLYWPNHGPETPIPGLWQALPQQRPAATTPIPLLMVQVGTAARTDAETSGLLEQLAQKPPQQSQCDILLSFYELHVNWVYAVIDMSAFRKQYNAFWLVSTDVNLTWVALLYAILCISVVYMPPELLRILELCGTATELAEKDILLRDNASSLLAASLDHPLHNFRHSLSHNYTGMR